jgi:hypothetical protein
VFSVVCTNVKVDDIGCMVYYDGIQTWSACRRCGTIQSVLYYPHRLGFLVPLCSNCAEEGAELLQRGQSVVRLSRTGLGTIEFRFLEDDYEIIE